MSQPSSAAFWSLIEPWRLSDEQALELISYEGKLPTNNRRPRFRLSADFQLTFTPLTRDWDGLVQDIQAVLQQIQQPRNATAPAARKAADAG